MSNVSIRAVDNWRQWRTAVSPRRHRRLATQCICVGVALASVSTGPHVAWSAKAVPAWIEAAAASRVPDYAQGARAFVPFRDRVVSLSPAGLATMRERYAVRILAREARDEALARIGYRTDGDRVLGLEAWLRSPSGSWEHYTRAEAVDIAMVGDDIYNEARVLVLSAVSDADSGAFFAFESVSEHQAPDAQFEWTFQNDLPTARSRFGVTLPAEWQIISQTFNHARIDSLVEGPVVVWELTDLRGHVEEPSAPPADGLVPRLGVTCMPPTAPGTSRRVVFRSWQDVSSWLALLNEEPGTVTAQVAEHARRLVVGARTRADSVSAVSRFAQDIHYASIQVGLARGGGYRAHPAGEVMAKAYGDCKDKANLMRVLLQAIGIPSWLVVVYSGDSRFVREEWPSPRQFNHCILGIQAWEGGPSLPMVEMPRMGGLVLFDPTAASTPFGGLPSSLQGGLALVVSREGGDLLRIPVSTPDQDLVRRRIHLVLSPDGAVKGQVVEESSGQSAAAERQLVEELTPEQYRDGIRAWLWRCAGAMDVDRLVFEEDSLKTRFTLRVDFHAENWGELAEAGLLVFRSSLSDRRAPDILRGRERKLPVVLRGFALHESLVVSLPSGYALDEFPEPARITAPFGEYTSSVDIRGGELVCTRRLTIRADYLPAEQYRDVQEFFTRTRGAESAAVVLFRR